MGISEEVKQTKFSSEYEKMAINMIFTTSWLNTVILKRLKPFGISPQQYNILRILRGQHPNPATVNLLQERMLDKMSNVSRLVEKLRMKGFVERRTSESDRRACDVIITEEGLRVLNEIDKTQKEWEENFKSLSTNEAREFNRLLDKLRE